MLDEIQPTHHVHIANPDIEERTLIELEVEVSTEEVGATGPTRTLALTEGGTDLVPSPPDAPFTFGASHDGAIQTAIIPDRGVALGHFIHALEINEAGPKDKVMPTLREYADLSAYDQMQDGLTTRDRRLRLFDLWDWRVEELDDSIAEAYRDEATWREQGLDESGRKLAEELTRNVEPVGTHCYYTAGEAAIHALNNHRVSYCEGVVLPRSGAQCIKHAWIEIDNSVAEICWPWHPYDGGDAVYLGMEIPKQKVKETRERRDRNGAVAVDDETLATTFS